MTANLESTGFFSEWYGKPDTKENVIKHVGSHGRIIGYECAIASKPASDTCNENVTRAHMQASM